MGSSKENNEKWSITVKTGDHKGSGTDCNIYVAFTDDQGKRSEDILLDVKWRNDFERGKEDVFPCPVLSDKMGTPCTMELWRDKSGVSWKWNWYCEVLKLQIPGEKTLNFPVLRWVEPGNKYKIPVNDTSLPQDDPYPEQRENELEVTRKKYTYVVESPDLPVQLESLPTEEEFSDDIMRSIKHTKRESLAAGFVGMLDFRDLTKYGHIERMYSIESVFPKPETCKFWNTDEWFAAQRLVGVNPMSIRLCTEIPQGFSVTDDHVQPFLEGLTLEKALEAKRLFIVDLTAIQGVKPADGFYLCYPRALFFVNNEKKLMPIAIQLFPGKYNPVFTPEIDKHKWTLVKMWFNTMDAQFQQGCYHLGFTHLIMESIVISVHRCLAKNHPIFRLLAPHFIYLLAIKMHALKKLLSQDGYVNKLMATGVNGLMQLFGRLYKSSRLDVVGSFAADLADRGVDDPAVLPEYPYRDDGLLLSNAIKEYVTDIVNIYYDTEDKISGDTELQAWAKHMVLAVVDGGLGIQGIPNGGEFKTTHDIIEMCTIVIFTCSVQHAAVNFGQYNSYSCIPNYPMKLKGSPPIDTNAITEGDVMSALMDKSNLYALLLLTKALSQKGTNSLGDWEVRYQYDPRALEVEERFRKNLQTIGEEIKKRNETRSEIYKYTYLDPANVPNAISI